jgi:segregation and condensation protein B
MSELTMVVEALLFCASEPVSVRDLAEAAAAPPERVERALDALRDRHREGRSGVVVERVGGGYAFRAADACAEACARLIESGRQRALSQAALETLAVIAYAGPVSRPEITRIRGVNADQTVASLVERGLVEEAGRLDAPGQAVMFRVTPGFSRAFDLPEGVASLPPLADLDSDERQPEALRDRLLAIAASREPA